MEQCCTVAAARGEQSDSHLNDSSDTTVPTATNIMWFSVTFTLHSTYFHHCSHLQYFDIDLQVMEKQTQQENVDIAYSYRQYFSKTQSEFNRKWIRDKSLHFV